MTINFKSPEIEADSTVACPVPARPTRLRIGARALFAAGLVASQPAAAVTFALENGVEGSFDSMLSYGVSIRAGNRDCRFIGQDNGGCASLDPVEVASRHSSQLGQSHDAARLNQDDGNLNYKKGQIFSSVLKGVHDFSLSTRDGWSTFVRGLWSYDSTTTRTKRTELFADGKRLAVGELSILDAFISKEFDWAGHSSRLRVGNQVLSWGEDVFIPGGINSINAIDLRRMHAPGVQLKEVIKPAPIISFNTKLAKNYSLGAYYQFRWNAAELDPSGTFFSTSDVGAKGSRGIFLPTSFANAIGLGPLPVGSLGDPGTMIVGTDPLTGLPYNRRLTAEELASAARNPVGGLLGAGTMVPRGVNNTPRNSGQLGFSFRHLSDETGNEAGLYYLRYHEKIPFLSIRTGATTANPFAWESAYFDYGADRELIGASYNMRVGEWSIGMEASYRRKESVAIDPTMVSNPANPYYCNGDLTAANYRPAGYVCKGAIETSKYQFHLSGMHVLAPNGTLGGALRLLGATEGSILAEAVVAHYPKLDLTSAIPYAVSANARMPTRTSSGFAGQVSLTYPNVWGTRYSLTPEISWSQGTGGVSASALPGFIRGNGVVSLGLVLDLKTKPGAKLRFDTVRNYGGGLSNPMLDRDYHSISISSWF